MKKALLLLLLFTGSVWASSVQVNVSDAAGAGASLRRSFEEALRVALEQSPSLKEAAGRLDVRVTRWETEKRQLQGTLEAELTVAGRPAMSAQVSSRSKLGYKGDVAELVKAVVQEMAIDLIGELEVIYGFEADAAAETPGAGEVMLKTLRAGTAREGMRVSLLRGDDVVAEAVITEAGLTKSKAKVVSGKITGGEKAYGTSLPEKSEGARSKRGRGKLTRWLGAAIGLGLIIWAATKDDGAPSAQAAQEEEILATSSASSISLVANPTSVPADGFSSSTVRALVRDANNVAVADGTPVIFSTTAGTIVIEGGTATATTQSGIATASLVAPSTAGSATVTARSGDASSSVTVTFAPVDSPPASIDLSVADNPISIASSGDNIGRGVTTVTATVRDAAGNAVADNTTVTFSTDIGTINGQASTTNGAATVTFSSTTTGTATVTAKAGTVTQTTTITVLPGVPHALEVAADPQVIEADGHNFSTITATVRDISGNLVADGTRVDFSVTPDAQGGGNGDITPVGFTLQGRATAILVSRVPGTTSTPSNSGTATIVATVPAATQSADIPAPSADITNSKTAVTFVSKIAFDLNFTAADTNLRGLDFLGGETTITVMVFDVNGNPVPDGTAVQLSVIGDIKNAMVEGDGPTIDGVAESKTTSGVATATLFTLACDTFDTGFNGSLSQDLPPAAGVCDPDGTGIYTPGNIPVRVVSGNVVREQVVGIVSGPANVNFTTISSPFGTDATGGTAANNRYPLGTCGDSVSLAISGRDINNNLVDDGIPLNYFASKGTVQGDPEFKGGVARATISTPACDTDAVPPGNGQLTIEILDPLGKNITLTFFYVIQ